MNFTKIIVLFSILVFIFCIPVSATNLILNPGFETGNMNNWSSSYFTASNVESHTGTYSAYKNQYFSTGASITSGYAYYISQSVNLTNIDTLSFYYKHATVPASWPGSSTSYVYCDINADNSLEWTNSSVSDSYRYASVDVSSFSGIKTVKLGGYFVLTGGSFTIHYSFDDIVAEYEPPAVLMEFTNEPIEVTTYAHLECNLDDYWNTHANEHFYLSYDYYYKNISDYTVIDYNELELNSQNTINMIPTYYPYFNQTGGCEIKASILYTYHDPVYTEEQLGGIGYYVSTVLVNSTYEPPEEPEEPEEPEIPDPEPEPDPEPDPPIPPTQPNGTGANQSINVSWTGEYYNAVNNTFGGLCSPIYNFTNWSLSPIYSLNNSIGEFNYHMNESFTQTAEDSSILYESINTIFGAIHPKIRNVITYYLIWIVLLIVLKKD